MACMRLSSRVTKDVTLATHTVLLYLTLGKSFNLFEALHSHKVGIIIYSSYSSWELNKIMHRKCLIPYVMQVSAQ